MVTKEQAVNAKHGDIFHFTGIRNECPCMIKVGPRGAKSVRIVRARVNGKCKTWVKSDRFKLPVVHGLKDFGYIEDYNAFAFHREEDCPLNKKQDEEY